MLATVPPRFSHLYNATCEAFSAGLAARKAASISKDIANSVLAEVEEIEQVSMNIIDARLAANTAKVAVTLAAESAEKAAAAAAIVVEEAKKMKVEPDREVEALRMIDIAVSAFNAATLSAKSAQILSEIADDASKMASETVIFSEVIDQVYSAISAAENIFRTANTTAKNTILTAIAGNSIIYYAGAPVVSFSFRGDRRLRSSRDFPDDVHNMLPQCQLAFFPTVKKNEIADDLFREIWNGAVFKWTITPEFKQTLSKMSMDWEICLGPINDTPE